MGVLATGYLVFYNVLQTIGWSLIGLIIGQYYLGSGVSEYLYDHTSSFLKLFQTAAVLEVIHCAVGLVRSSVFLTGFQVASRVMVVWGVLHSAPDSQKNQGYPLLLVAWTITEIIRYSFYTINLAKLEAKPLVWLRYTLFIILYPIGVTGELMCIYTSLPYVEKTGIYSIHLPNAWNFAFNYKIALMLIMLSYIPIFPQLYLHMFSQRRKIIGGSSKSKVQ